MFSLPHNRGASIAVRKADVNCGALIDVSLTAGSRETDDAAGKTPDPGAASLLDQTANIYRRMNTV
jgi:hypothetical protein